MCGIVGQIQRQGEPIETERLRNAANVLRSRGPDDMGIWQEAGAALGHRRLAVLDLSSAGHQPMQSCDERFIIVHNGEIYNFRELRNQLHHRQWKSETDTEVILEAYRQWGHACLEHFDGMFAFAIWDRQKKELFLARDRLGIKPLFYSLQDNSILFASRPAALLTLRPDLSSAIDPQALRYYLEMGYIPSPHSFYRDIQKLPPAHYLVWNNSPTIRRYWDFRHIQPEQSWEMRRQDDLMDELEELLLRSVNQRLISDVPVGTFLSGGIDSSLISAAVTRNSSLDMQSFHIGFRESRFDESMYARQVAQQVGTKHHHETCEVNGLLDLLDSYVQHFDEPFFDTAAFPTMLMSRMARKHVTVCLSGDGGDELFGGYHYYDFVHKAQKWNRFPAFLRGSIPSFLQRMGGHRGHILAQALRQPNPIQAFAFARSIAKDYNTIWQPHLDQETQSMADLFLSRSTFYPETLSAAEKAMRMDIETTLVDDYLQKVDVSSMSTSLEVRVPLLDHAIVEWAMRLPLCWKIRSGKRKYLLRALAHRCLGPAVSRRRKTGFVVPIHTWLRGPLRQWAQDRLQDTGRMEALALNPVVIRDLWKLHLDGRRNVHPLLWAVLMLMEYRAKHATGH